MSTTARWNRLTTSTRSKLRARRDDRAFRRAYDTASPAMQAELLAFSQRATMR